MLSDPRESVAMHPLSSLLSKDGSLGTHMAAGPPVMAGSEPTQPKLLSCVNCRQRKVKCNRTVPCGPCQRSNVECVYPARVRHPRGRPASGARDNELLKRISRLENLVDKVGGEKALLESRLSKTQRNEPVNIGHELEDEITLPIAHNPDANPDCAIGGKYLGAEFWVNLSDDLDDLKQLLQQSSLSDDEEAEDEATPSTSGSNQTSPPNFVFGLPQGPILHPPPHEAIILFKFYFRNIDPVFKILHRPTAMGLLSKATDFFLEPPENGSLPALFCSIYLAAVTSLSPAECLTTLGQDKEILQARYKDSTEKALANADFLSSTELTTLQAFTIYLLCLRSYNKSRAGWTLIGLAVRIAHSMGLHRDGDGLPYSIYDAEMRRRLWWQIVVLDNRTAEDRASDPMIFQYSFNTKMPSNINDDDFNPSTPRPLLERQENTEMIFCHLVHDLSHMLRHLSYIPPYNNGNNPKHLANVQHLEDDIKEFNRHIEITHLNKCDLSIPLHWVTTMVGRLIALKLWMYFWYPQSQITAPRREIPKEEALRVAVDILETSELLEANNAVSNFRWFFATFVQWHPLAVALANLCVQTRGPLPDKAWPIIDHVFIKWGERVADTKEGTLWRPIRVLYKKARAARLRETNGSTDTGENSAMTDNTPPSIVSAKSVDEPGTRPATPETNSMTFEVNLTDLSYRPEVSGYSPPIMNISGSEIYADPADWTVWNEFIVDAGGVGMSVQSDLYDGWIIPDQFP